MKAIISPLVDGVVLVDPVQLEVKWLDPSIKIKEYTAQVAGFKVQADAYAAKVDTYGHIIDAIRYGMSPTVIQDPAAYPPPPAVPEGLTPEQHAAHLAIYDLVSAEEFEVLRQVPGFVQINKYWGAIGARKFCCEQAMAPRYLGERGYVPGSMHTSSAKLNEAWMAQLEMLAQTEMAQPVPRSAWEKIKKWLKR